MGQEKTDQAEIPTWRASLSCRNTVSFFPKRALQQHRVGLLGGFAKKIGLSKTIEKTITIGRASNADSQVTNTLIIKVGC